LREIADRMGCEIVKVYKDHGITQASVRRLAAEVLARYPKLEVLVNNAGAMYGRRHD